MGCVGASRALLPSKASLFPVSALLGPHHTCHTPAAHTACWHQAETEILVGVTPTRAPGLPSVPRNFSRHPLVYSEHRSSGP